MSNKSWAILIINVLGMGAALVSSDIGILKLSYIINTSLMTYFAIKLEKGNRQCASKRCK